MFVPINLEMWMVEPNKKNLDLHWVVLLEMHPILLPSFIFDHVAHNKVCLLKQLTFF